MQKRILLLLLLLGAICLGSSFAQPIASAALPIIPSSQNQHASAFPGGEQALKSFIIKQLVYPKTAIDNAQEGIVKIRFLVRKSGDIDQISMVKSIGFGCDEAAIKLVKEMPCWQPAVRNGIAIEKWVTLELAFRLI
ncbi:MAG: energy transducer TonB [Saprospiraceae bacterium]|nr:energy transducer TonB [Saprospiraceae bacterium]